VEKQNVCIFCGICNFKLTVNNALFILQYFFLIDMVVATIRFRPKEHFT